MLSYWHEAITGSGNALVSYRRQAIACANGDQFVDIYKYIYIFMRDQGPFSISIPVCLS